MKILQTLSALTQNYSSNIRGDLLFGLLQVCSTLQASKQASVSNSAAATLQQLIAALFEGLEAEDAKAHEVPTVAKVPSSTGDVHVRPFAYDAFRVFHDLCLITEGQKPQYLTAISIPQASGLELIESILSSHALVFDEHPEQANVLRTVLMPFIIRSLSERQNFAITVRILRVLSSVVRLHLTLAPSECEIALSLLNHMLDPDAATSWKRALCMEVFLAIYSDMGVLLQLCSTFDQQEGKKQVLRDNLAIFVRLASEKPAAIGLGQHSTAPAGAPLEDDGSDTGTIEATGVAGFISSSGGAPNKVGISAYLSTVKTAFLDQLDKSESPPVPETYIYALVLTCVNHLSDCLARFILPLTVHRDSRGRKRADTQETIDSENARPAVNEDGDAASLEKLAATKSGIQRRRNVPVNPLTLEGHKTLKGVQSIATLIESSWPAVLATCSTFLYASLDNDYYRSLVRSVQKFTQVAGLLRMNTPRDALLTTLCKAAVPANVIAASMSPSTSVPESPSTFKTSFLSVDSLVNQGSSNDGSRRGSADSGPTDLNARNLLCLRALLNIAIALGPTLMDAWGIVCESLQQAEMIMSTSIARGNRSSRASFKSPQRPEADTDSSQSVATEVNAVQAAATRMFESSADFPDDAFVSLLEAMCRLLDEDNPPPSGDSRPNESPSRRQHQRRVGSFSSISVDTDSQIRDLVLVLRKVGDISALNVERFTQDDSESSGWTMLASKLTSLACRGRTANAARKLAAEIMCHLVQDTVKATSTDAEQVRSMVQQRGFDTLVTAIQTLRKSEEKAYARDFDSEIHLILLETLKLTIEASGDTLVTGWTQTFGIVLTAFNPHSLPAVDPGHMFGQKATHLEELRISFTHAKIGRAAFDTIQLICSDFLSKVSEDQLALLVDILFCFCVQQDDLNIALTITGLFWHISDFLQSHSDGSQLSSRIEDLVKLQTPPTQTSTSPADGIYIIWLRLLRRLVTITADPRSEVRDTAIHTLFRILGNSELTAKAWSFCLGAVLFPMFDYNVLRHGVTVSTDSATSQNWINTSQLMLDRFSELFAGNVLSLKREATWPQLFEGLIDRLKAYLELQLRITHAIVYSNLANVLSHVPDGQGDFLTDDIVAHLWLAYSPTKASADGEATTAKAYEAYVRCFKQFYRLLHLRMLYNKPEFKGAKTHQPQASGKSTAPPADKFNSFWRLLQSSAFPLDLPSADLQQTSSGLLAQSVESLLECASTSSQPAYGSDVDNLTALQSEILGCLQDINRKNRKAQSLLLTTLARLVSLPFQVDETDRSSARPTFVAFAKAAMGVLHTIATDSAHSHGDVTGEALTCVLASLAQPIQLKYQWPAQGRAPLLWQKATTTALSVLRRYLEPKTRDPSSIEQHSIEQIWLLAVVIAQGIASAEYDDRGMPPTKHEDEQFDMEALTDLRELLIPALGSQNVPDSIRRAYASSLFLNSLIHKTEHGEYPQPPAEPLEGLYDIRLGRTTSPPPAVRLDMAYYCFEALLELTATSPSGEETPERIALAKAAAPYLILRAALPLKAYTADQSLRGRMPQPYTEREELLFVLRKMTALKTVPKAIPAAAGASSETKRHLLRLYQLVVKAQQVAGRARGLAKDDELIEAMTQCFDTVGGGFGI